MIFKLGQVYLSLSICGIPVDVSTWGRVAAVVTGALVLPASPPLTLRAAQAAEQGESLALGSGQGQLLTPRRHLRLLRCRYAASWAKAAPPLPVPWPDIKSRALTLAWVVLFSPLLHGLEDIRVSQMAPGNVPSTLTSSRGQGLSSL